MEKLRCDICGGQIEMQSDRRGLCTNCGTVYSLDAMREMFNGAKVSVTGSQDDVEQWRQLVKKYYDAGDFPEAERVVKKIMEALPNDQEASQLYDDLQTLKYMEIKNGILLRYTGKAERVTIPSCVSVVDKEAFQGAEFLREVVIPGTVKELRDCAFRECLQLDSIVLSSSETKLGVLVFASCINLTKVQLPADMQEIPARLFEGCISLAQITLPSELKIIGPGAFFKCCSLQNITIPNSVTIIGCANEWEPEGWFGDDEKLGALLEGSNKCDIEKWLDGVKPLGAFQECSALTAVKLLEGIKIIGDETFSGCERLEQVDIPEGLLKIGERAFQDCSALTAVTLPEGVKIIGAEAFLGCKCLEQVDLPNGMIRIGAGAFQGCSALTAVALPEGVEIIGTEAFSGCKSFEQVNISEGLLIIGDRAFQDCSALTAVALPEGVEIIGAEAFSGCKSLKQVNISEGLLKIGDRAFADCVLLKYLKVPTTVREIGNGAFQGCIALSTLDITPEQIRDLGILYWDCCGYGYHVGSRFGGNSGPWVKELAAQGLKYSRKGKCIFCGSKLRRLPFLQAGTHDCPKCHPEKFKKNDLFK